MKFLEKYIIMSIPELTLSWRRPLSYRNQSIDLFSKSMDWFLYVNGLCLERVKFETTRLSKLQRSFMMEPILTLFWYILILKQTFLILPLYWSKLKKVPLLSSSLFLRWLICAVEKIQFSAGKFQFSARKPNLMPKSSNSVPENST